MLPWVYGRGREHRRGIQYGGCLCSIKRKTADARGYGKWGIEAKLVKRLSVDTVKKDAVGAANNSLGVAKDIPGKTNPGRKIVLIRTICINAKLGRNNQRNILHACSIRKGLARLRPAVLHDKGIAQDVVDSSGGQVQLVPQSVIQSQPRKYAVRIFGKEIDLPVSEPAHGRVVIYIKVLLLIEDLSCLQSSQRSIVDKHGWAGVFSIILIDL